MSHTVPLASLALAGLLLTPLVARADHDWDDDARWHHHHEEERWSQPPPVEMPPVQQVQPQVPPPAPVGQQGRYELRTVTQWVAGHYTQVWIPQRCHFRPFHWGHNRCEGGFYDQRWVPGGQVQAQQWVWVPAPVTYPPAYPSSGYPATGYPADTYSSTWSAR